MSSCNDIWTLTYTKTSSLEGSLKGQSGTGSYVEVFPWWLTDNSSFCKRKGVVWILILYIFSKVNYICVYVCVRLCVHVNLSLCVYTCVFVYVCMHACVCTHAHTCMQLLEQLLEISNIVSYWNSYQQVARLNMVNCANMWEICITLCMDYLPYT